MRGRTQVDLDSLVEAATRRVDAAEAAWRAAMKATDQLPAATPETLLQTHGLWQQLERARRDVEELTWRQAAERHPSQRKTRGSATRPAPRSF